MYKYSSNLWESNHSDGHTSHNYYSTYTHACIPDMGSIISKCNQLLLLLHNSLPYYYYYYITH